jgi:hypothetical protein
MARARSGRLYAERAPSRRHMKRVAGGRRGVTEQGSSVQYTRNFWLEIPEVLDEAQSRVM